jgi:hypothetical protein
MFSIRSFALCLASLAGSAAPAFAGLVNRYTFDNPLAGNAAVESDLGSDNTPINLFNGALRVADGAFPGSAFSFKSGPVADPPANNDFKAGVFFPGGSATSTLGGTANVTGVTIMGWFKPLVAPSGTTSMIGLIRGDAGGVATTYHDGRALIEMGMNGGQMKMSVLGRRLDTETTGRPVSITTDTVANILPTNQWTHIAAVFDYDLGSMKLYRNGVLLPASTPSFADWALTAGVDRTSNSASDAIKIGGQLDDDTTPFNGLIDEVRIYNEALPATGANSIQSIYLAQAVPEPGTLVIVGIGLLPVFCRRRSARQ